jgi:hypothetical protein
MLGPEDGMLAGCDGADGPEDVRVDAAERELAVGIERAPGPGCGWALMADEAGIATGAG